MPVNRKAPSFQVYVPMFNEEAAVGPLLEEFARLRIGLSTVGVRLGLTFVDDGSTDGTYRKIQHGIRRFPGATVLRHRPNLGLCRVLETILRHEGRVGTRENRFGVGLLDGDHTHPPSVFLSMVLKLMEGYDVVIASRFRPGSCVKGVSFPRRLFSLAASLLFRMIWRIPHVRDYTCGFRAYRASLFFSLSQVTFGKRSFAAMAELLGLCHQRGALCTEVPFLLRYDQKQGSSKMPLTRTIVESLSLAFARPHG